MELREREKKLTRDQLDGLNLYTAGKAMINDTFDRYIKMKPNLRDSTRSNYTYMYSRFVRNDFGKKKLIDIKYSDIVQYYLHLINDEQLAIATVDNIHMLLHPTFQMAVRDDIIRKNPTDGVMTEITKKSGIHRGVRHALTAEQQKAFMDYIANHPVLCIGGRFLPFCLERDVVSGKGLDYGGRTSTLRKISSASITA